MQQIKSILQERILNKEILKKKEEDSLFLDEIQEINYFCSLNQNMSFCMLANFYLNKLEETDYQLKLLENIKLSKDPIHSNLNLKQEILYLSEIKDKIKIKIKESLSKVLKEEENLNLIQKNKNKTSSILKEKEATLKLKVYYYDGAEHKPQQIQLKLQNKIDLNSFYSYLKKSLGIYVFSKFNIMLKDKLNNYNLLQTLDEFNFEKENTIKIVPFV